MDKRHVNVIRYNFNDLIDVTHHIDDIINKLEQRCVLNSNMVKFLMLSNDQRKKLENFFEMIQGRGPTAFHNLLIVLRETRNFRAEKMLNENNRPTYGSESLTETKLSKLGASEDVYDGVGEALKLVVKVHPDKKFMDIDEDNPPHGTYRMRSKPRGHALIINIYRTLNDHDRKGSEVDEKKLNKLFTDLGFKVDSWRNLNLKEMQDIIKDFSCDPGLASVDCTVLFIMSHGKQSKSSDTSVDLITSDARNLNTKWIIDQFFSTESKLVSKARERKPKLFFFQACRCPDDEKQGSANIRWGRVETDSVLISNGQCPSRKHEDIFQIFSTISGYPSMRDKVTGAWFVDTFCEIVAENAWRYDLDAMMGMVDEKISKLYSEYGYQTPEFVKQGVSKKLYLNPGL